MVEKRIKPGTAIGYALVAAAGLALVALGAKDLLLLVIGKPVAARITSTDTRAAGRRRGGSRTTVRYEYVVDGVQHEGGGPWGSRRTATVGGEAEVRYLPFAPGASAPADALVGPGIVLVAVGGTLLLTEVSFLSNRRKRAGEADGEKPGRKPRAAA